MKIILDSTYDESMEALVPLSLKSAISALQSGNVEHITYGAFWHSQEAMQAVARYVLQAVIAQHIPKPEWSISRPCWRNEGVQILMKQMDRHCYERSLEPLEHPLAPEKLHHWGLRQEHSFQNFILREGNILARTYAFISALNEGKSRNPLIIHGTNEAEMTHLLQSIGLSRAQLDPTLNLLYLDGRW